MSKNISYLTGKKGIDKNLFEEIGILARPSGTPAVEEMERLAQEFLIGKANVYGSASFYDFTRQANEGKKVYLCNGSSCLTAGTQPAVHKKLRKHFAEEEIGEMCCLGRCHENASFHFEGHNYSGEAIDEVKNLLKKPKAIADQYRVAHLGVGLLTQQSTTLDYWTTLLSNTLKKSADELLEELKTSGLRGRGGAGFPMSFKLESCRNTEATMRFIVCNADEGDPGAYSDRYLMEQKPYAVLVGMILAGYIAGASHGVLYIRGEYPESVEMIQKSIFNLEKAGWLGENIHGGGFSFHFKVIKAQGAYICGEETALLSSIEGQRPEVRVRPPYPAQQGLFNKPTVVNNVETLACVPWILLHGGVAFAEIGRGKSTGTKLVSLDGFFRTPGIYEVDMGTPLQQVLDELGGGFKEDIKAVHIGGPLGGLVPVEKIKELSVDFESFQQAGFLLGHASVVCLPNAYPLVAYLEHLFAFTAHESCGKCFPCRLGSTRGKELFQKAQESDYKIDRQLLLDLLETMEIGSLCALGGGVPLPIKNALRYFDEELSQYLEGA